MPQRGDDRSRRGGDERRRQYARTIGTDRGPTSVSRRRFVEAAGAAGIVAGLGGCITANDGGDGTQEGEIDVGEVPDEDITLEWAASEEEAGASDEIVQALHQAGMPENIDINFLSGGNVTSDRQNQYEQWLAAGRTRPDLLRMDNGWTIPFIVRNRILNLERVLDDETVNRVKENYFSMTAQTAMHPQNETLHAIPLWMGLPTIQYRKDLVEQAGYDPEGNNWATESMTWQRFSEVTADVMQQSNVNYGYTFQADVYEGLSCCNFNEFMSGWGGAYFGGVDNLFGPVGERPITVNEPPVHDSIRMIRSFIHGNDAPETLDSMTGNISPTAVLNWTEQSSMRVFSNGNAVMHRNWPHSIRIHGAEDAMGQNLGVMPIPYSVTEEEAEYAGVGGPVAALGGWHVAINPNTERMASAVAAIEAATTDEFNLALFEILGQIPPKPELLETQRARDIPIMGRYMDQLQVAGENAVARPVTVVWPDESTQISQAVHSAYTGDKSPQQAMSDLESTLEQIEQSA
ncbi:extracellular solute-binding protein [Natronoarchaeum mannanilyticum]|uniref:extracellular solute-binding protein n=1 Tax=Natronoarchaeum mannanilyticum TaxID=926360 RepID=UPI0031DCA48D